MAKGPTATEKRLDELYREPPDGFVAARDALARELRAAGERDEAERIKKLRRPSAAAWLLNRAALSAPKRLAEFARASEELERAQARALEGEADDASVWRSAAKRERDASGAVVETAKREATDAGQPAAKRALELVDETLRAAAVDPELRDRVLRGRLEREQSAATLGTPPAGSVPPARESAKRSKAAKARRAAASARRELERLRDELADAEGREERLAAQVAQTTDILKQEKAKLADAKREAAKLRRRLATAERRAG